MRKVFERLIHVHDHLMEHSREADVIPPEHTGFRRGVACDHHLVKLQAHTIERMKNNNATAFISLDCSHDFQNVSHPLLLRRLEEFRFPAALWRLVKNYLSERSFVVRVGGDLSPPAPPPVEYLKDQCWDLCCLSFSRHLWSPSNIETQ
nr:uncharacterized protein LOC106683582 [Halyomorpha halys]